MALKIKEGYEIFEEKEGVFQIRCKSDVIIVEFFEEEKRSIFLKALEIIRNSEVNFSKLREILENEFDKTNVLDVLDKMLENEIIVEYNLKFEVSDWLKDQNTFVLRNNLKDYYNILEKSKITIIGETSLVKLINDNLIMSGFKNVKTVYGFPQELFDILNESDFIIVDADKYNPSFLYEFNKKAYEMKKPWLISMGVDETIISIGPIFTYDSLCFECLMRRIKSNLEFFVYFESFEKYLIEKRKSATNSGAPLVVYNFISSIITIETIKFLTQFSFPLIYRNFLTIDFTTYDVKINHVLKVPACPICSKDTSLRPLPWIPDLPTIGGD